MSLLAEIDLGSAMPWRDLGDHTWLNTDDHTWFDGAGYALCSMDGFAGDHYWDPYIIDFSPPRFQAPSVRGGYCKMDAGSITFSQDVFANAELWPPPPSFKLVIYYTATTEEKKQLLFEGSGHLSRLNRGGIDYDLYGKEYDTDLLDEEHQYSEDAENDGYEDEDKTAIPRAFGEVVHVNPVRGPDDGSSRPTFYKSGITGTLAKQITVSANNGSGKVRFTTAAAHGFTTGDSVTVEVDDFGSTYNTTQTATVIDSTNFDFTSITYVDDQDGHAYKTGYWRVYDDGVPIAGSVLEEWDGTFSLTVALVGTCTISGTGEDTTLSEIIEWACNVLRLNLTYSSVYARSPSPSLSYWANSQTVLIEFLSEICQFWCHAFYVLNDIVFLVDLMADHGERSYTEYDFFPSDYSYQSPISMLKCEWVASERIEDSTGKHLKDVDYETTLAGLFAYGEEEDISPYSTDKIAIDLALADIKTRSELVQMDLKIPLLSDMFSISWVDTDDNKWADTDDHIWITTEAYKPPPLIGERIWLSDTSMKHTFYVGIRALGVQYDFGQGVVSVESYGSIAYTRDEVHESNIP